MTEPTNNPAPSGFIARCRCGSVTGAADAKRTEKKDLAKMLGEWLMDGKTVIPQFGNWSSTLSACRCDTAPTDNLTPGPVREKPLAGRWRHGGGFLICGSFRVMRLDPDFEPTEKRKTEILDWIVDKLNQPDAAMSAEGEEPTKTKGEA